MRMVVTGAAGFVGSHVVDALLARGDTVVGIDDCSTGELRNLQAAQKHPHFSLRHGSVCDELLMEEACAGAEVIIHLAAAVGVKRILAKQVASIVTNINGTEVMLRVASANRALVFLASSSEVYGKAAKTPFSEGDDCVLGPTSLHRWSYACSKAMDEFLTLAYVRERSLRAVIARYFNITGPRQSPSYGMVLPRFCAAALRGEPLQVYGDGQQSRVFVHVADAVAATLALINCPTACGQVVNVGGVTAVTMLELAKRVVAISGSRSGVELVPYAQAYPEGGFEDLRQRTPDTSRLRGLTSWSPTRSLDDIIADCLAESKARLHP